MSFTFLDHTADIKFKVVARTQTLLFDEITKALAHYLTGGKKVEANFTKKICLSGRDMQEIIYKFIDELIYLIDAEQFIASSASITIKDGELEGTLKGDSSRKYSINGVKAATYAEMNVEKTKKGWSASVVIDV